MADQTPQINTNLTLDNSRLIVHVGGEHVLNILLDEEGTSTGITLYKVLPCKLADVVGINKDGMLMRLQARHTELMEELDTSDTLHPDRIVNQLNEVNTLMYQRRGELKKEMAKERDE
ncbi:MAG: hypothetical protein ACXQS4_02030 [Methermicoccaceae archaeon]